MFLRLCIARLKRVVFDMCIIAFGCLLMMAGPLLQAIGVIGG